MNKTIKSIVTILTWCTLVVYANSEITAANITDVEQQINIINQEYNTTATTASPTDNSLGLVLWDQDLYNNEAVYFEAVIYCNTCVLGNQQVVAGLYSDTGGLVTGSQVTTTQTSYTRVRTGDISSNLTDGEEYTIRLTVDAVTGTAYVKAARLVVDQSHTAITDTETQVELGNNATTTSTTYELMAGPKIYHFDTNMMSDKTGAYFEASLQGSDGSAVAYASLSSSATCASTVSGSEVSVTGTTWGRARSSSILANLTDDTDYWVCIHTTAADTGSIANAKLIFTQSNATAISAIETIQLYINHPSSDADSTYTSQDFLNQYDPANFVADREQYFYESTIQTTGGTAFTRLYNVTDTVNITNAERTSTATSYERVTSPDISDTLPVTAKTLDTELRNSATNTTTASSSWLRIHLQEDPSLTFTIAAVAADQVHNDITTTVASTYDTLPFGSLAAATPRYAAHSLYVETNALHGYAVQTKLDNYLQGTYAANNIDPFVAAWSAPTTWTEPTGTVASVDTGWIGANTTDTRVAGWSTGSQLFGALGGSFQSVMYSSVHDTGTTAYVTYAIEANVLQPADLYSGTLMYTISALY